VIARRDCLGAELASLESLSDRISTLAADVDRARAAYLEVARALSGARRAAAVRFARAIERQLADLALERCRFEVRFGSAAAPEPGWSARGIDEAEFFLSPNPGEDPRPLARIVSGGELSRIMLALKTLASTDEPGKSLILRRGGRRDRGGCRRRGQQLRTWATGSRCFASRIFRRLRYGQSHFHISKRLKQGERSPKSIGSIETGASMSLHA
jgi:DNA repair protein RecN (Recombination protein N)